jgi:hypothetical protein
MTIRSKVLATAAALVLAGGIGVLGVDIGTADATTLTCTNTQGVTTVAGAAYGCGGAAIIAGYPSGSLSLAATVNAAGQTYDSAPVTAEPTDELSPRLDFTVFNLCDPNLSSPAETVGGSFNVHECTAPAATPPAPGSPPLPETLSGAGLGLYVVMITPLGQVADFTVTAAAPAAVTASSDYSGTCLQVPGSSYANTVPCPGETFEPGPGTYCISVADFKGPNGKVRWWALARQCDTNGQFTAGTAVTPGTVDWNVANKWQVWEPQIGSSGLLFENASLRNRYDSEYDLNITGARGAGTQLQAYPDNAGGAVNDQFDYTACTPPGTLLSVFGRYGLC